MKIKDVIQYLEQLAPAAYQEDYDNAGLIVGDAEAEVSGVLLCLDSTEAVVAEAVRKGYNLVVAHHPIVFKGLKRLTGRTYVERTVISAIRSGVAIYAIHTNLDNVFHRGVSARIAERLGLTATRLLAPKQKLQAMTGGQSPQAAGYDVRYVDEEAVGAGVIGELAEPMEEHAFLHFLRERMSTPCIRHTRLPGRSVRRVAVCGGAGGFLLPHAIAQGADVFVTADYKYHEFFDADGRLIIADIGHYESEQFTIGLLQEIISEKFSNFAACCTEVNTNPVQYLY